MGPDQNTGPVPVRDTDGQEVGSVKPPPGVEGVLVVQGSDPSIEYISQVVSIALDVTIRGTDGKEQTQFSDDIEICISTEGFDSDDVCLGFYNDDNEWECEDYCVDESTNEDGQKQICGGTKHLTNFALLLSSEANSSARCGSSSDNLLYVYLSVAFVGAAICIVVMAVVLIEVRLRYGVRKTNKRLTLHSDHSNSSRSVPDFVEPSYD